MDKNYNFIKDCLGNIRYIFSEKLMYCEYDYDSLGNCHIKAYDNKCNIVNDSNHVAYINPFRWKSYYLDSESGLYMCNTANGTRYYDPEIGRFINRYYSATL